jgi:hypothetical protein
VFGTTYTISYYPIAKGEEVTLPKADHYKISGDNMEGVIPTVDE